MPEVEVLLPPDLNLEGASPSIRGFIYQFERGIYWLAISKDENAHVGIETGDDLAIVDSAIEKRRITFEQDKLTKTTTFPFGDKDKNLWRTILNWLKILRNHKTDEFEVQFYMGTNSTLGKKKNWVRQFLYSTSPKKINAMQAAKDLIKIGKEISPKSNLRKVVDEVLGFSLIELEAVVKKIVLFDGTSAGNINSMKKEIKNHLSISNRLPWNTFYDELLGWFIAEIKSLWGNGKPGVISRESLLNRANSIVKRLLETPFIEAAKGSIRKLNDSEIQTHKHYTYVKQVDLIDLSEEEVLQAISDYYCASSERVRLAKLGGLIGEKDFIEFEDRLLEKWSRIFSAEKRIGRLNDPKDVGYKIYTEIRDHREILAGIQTSEYYLTCGTYHKLSNEKLLGWHPEWKKLIEEND